MAFNPAVFSLHRRTLTIVLIVLLVGAGALAYGRLGRLEYPSFSIKTAMILTSYPGASPEETEQEVTDVIEEAVQSMEQVKRFHSTSQEGLSIVFVDMKDRYRAAELPQVWDELRRKVGDAQRLLPPGAGTSLVKDDFGDVYGLFFAVTGEGYSYRQLEDYAEELKSELLLCRDVGKVRLWGTREERIYLDFTRSRLVGSALSPKALSDLLLSQNLVRQSGNIAVGGRYVRISPTGDFGAERAIGDLLVGGGGGLVRLGDVASLSRGYEDPPRNLLRFNGKRAVGLGISTVAGGNVVTMGEAVRRRLAELEGLRPLGMELEPIYGQDEIVVASIDQFVINLLQSLSIVIGLLLLFMGWRSGLLIGFSLLLTLLATFIGMLLMGVTLQKVSLGALILALGMLVDNAIVVVDGMLVRMARGEGPEEAACSVAAATQWPLLGATAVAILAFAAIGLAPGNVGEFCRSLFQVMALSLFLSWIVALTAVPLLGVLFLVGPPSDAEGDPHDGPFLRLYRRFVQACLRRPRLLAGIVVVSLFGALAAFRNVPQSFFPPTTQPYFSLNIWKPQGTAIEETDRTVASVEAFLRDLPGVRNVASFVGEGALRYVLNYNYESPNSSYGQILVEVDGPIEKVIADAEAHLRRTLSDGEFSLVRVMTGPSKAYSLEIRLRGPDASLLKSLARRCEALLRRHDDARDVGTDWRQPLFVLRPLLAEDRGRRGGVGRREVASALQWNFGGTSVGLYREGDKLIPIVARPVEAERFSAQEIGNVQVWSDSRGGYLPLRQVVSSVETVWEDPLIRRRDGERTITVQANSVRGLAEPLRREIAPDVEALELPPGYSLEWGGEYLSSKEAREPLGRIFPLCLAGMMLLLIGLFDSIRRALIVFLTAPLSVIGVVIAFLLTGQAFGFMAILGFLGLSGMLIKNAIVLIDQIEIDRVGGKPIGEALADASVSRLRPVVMAAGTTILGMIPLVKDPLYSGMALTVMGGLLVGTFLTLVVVPVLYRLFFGDERRG